MPKISICTPCYNERENIRRCHETVKRIFDTHLPHYEREHIFADNGSTDGTVAILREIAAADPSAKVILNMRNFGIVRSGTNCMLAASGDAVFMFMPADLQDPPELMPDFVKRWEEGYEVVYGTRDERDEGWLMVAVRKTYYRLLRRLSAVDLPMNVSDYQLIDRKVMDAIRQYDDFYPFMRAITFQCTSRTIGIPYRWQARAGGKSKNHLIHLIDQGLNGLISTTHVPVRMTLIGGLLIASLSLVYALVNVVTSLLWPPSGIVQGIRTLIAGMFFFNGLTLLVVGFIGEYTIAIHQQVRRRPRVLERERINFATAEDGQGG